MTPKAIILPISLIFSLFFVACGGNNANPVQSDHLRPMDTPRSVFTANKQEINANLLTQNELSSILICDKPSTSQRLDAEKYSTSFQTVTRKQTDVNHPIATQITRKGYRTDNYGKTYTSTFELNDLSIDGVSAIEGLQYAYTDSCSTSKGCDSKERVFSVGNAWSAVKARAKFEHALEQALENTEDFNCTHSSDPDAEKISDKLVEGTIQIGTLVFPALQLTSQTRVLLNCSGTFVGKGILTKKEIIIADLLPNVTEQSTLSLGEMNLDCPRTRVFSGTSLVADDGTTISGRSTDLSEHLINGTVETLEEWEKNKDELAKTHEHLKSAVTLAESRYNDAKVTYASAQAYTQSSLTQATSAKAEAEKALDEANAINGDPGATSAEKKAANDKYLNKASYSQQTQKAYEEAMSAERAARQSLDLARANLERAKKDLIDFQNQNF